MKFKMVHMNINVANLEKSLDFYMNALKLSVARQKEFDTFTLVYLQDESSNFELELTYLHDHANQAYDLGENETHLCFVTDDYDQAHQLHQEMGVICFENEKMGLYFIEDPDGYWIEIVTARG